MMEEDDESGQRPKEGLSQMNNGIWRPRKEQVKFHLKWVLGFEKKGNVSFQHKALHN